MDMKTSFDSEEFNSDNLDEEEIETKGETKLKENETAKQKI
jgi:hypothetical protein